MHYPLGKWQTAVKEVLEGLDDYDLRVDDSGTRRILKKHGIVFSPPRKRKGRGMRVVVRDKHLTLVPSKGELAQERISGIQNVINLANSRHGTNAKIIQDRGRVIIRQ